MSQQLLSATELHPAGEAFARALASQDAASLRAVLADPIDFAALTPGRAWSASSVDEVVVEIVLGKWFGPGSEILGIEELSGGRLPAREHVSYRLLVRRADGDYLVEQQAYYNTTAGRDGAERISWLRVLCSGYQLKDPR